MAVFIVHLSSKDPEQLAAKLEELFPHHYHRQLSERTYLVRTDIPADRLVDKIGLGSEDTRTGTVFKLNSAYGGYDDSTIWDWLDRAEE